MINNVAKAAIPPINTTSNGIKNGFRKMLTLSVNVNDLNDKGCSSSQRWISCANSKARGYRAAGSVAMACRQNRSRIGSTFWSMLDGGGDSTNTNFRWPWLPVKEEVGAAGDAMFVAKRLKHNRQSAGGSWLYAGTNLFAELVDTRACRVDYEIRAIG